ncbi:putative monovalent cation/H+ antiporter subunit B [Salinisphaera sp. PC39]|uniref:Na(+)/H(+) antiporter subunit B n=1 Tax=Salinisphaera sp. PC39 TaxID=1304156 RepID=UPI0033426C3E
MREHTILRVIAKTLAPPILLFGLYVQFHGEYSPGGGFQAGVIVSAAIILYALVFGLAEARRVVPPFILRWLAAAGLLLFAGTGIATMLLGHDFLDYDALAQHPKHGQHIGIIVVELGVGLTVTAVVTGFFFVFAGRGRRRDGD